MKNNKQKKKGSYYWRKFKGQKYYCDISGFTIYETEMVKKGGKKIKRGWEDRDD